MNKKITTTVVRIGSGPTPQQIELERKRAEVGVFPVPAGFVKDRTPCP